MVKMEVNQQIINLFPVPAFLVRIDTLEIVLFNKKGLALTKLSEKALKKCRINDFINPQFLKIGEYDNCCFNTNNLDSLIGNISVQSSGEEFFVVSFYVVDSSLGQISQDKKCETQYKAMMDRSFDSIFIMEDGIIQYANQQLIRASGYSLEELTGRKFTDFVATEELGRVGTFSSQRKKGGKVPMIYESIARIKNGDYVEVEVNFVNVVYKGKSVQQVMLRDITKRKIAERKYRNIINFAPIGFYQSTREGEFLHANNELANLLGYKNYKELISKNISDFYYSSNEREKLIAKYDTANKSDVKNIEVKFKKKDGGAIWVLMTSKAIKNGNNVTQYYDGFLVDITDRKTHEQEIARLYKAIGQSPSPVALTDLNGKFIYVNPRYCNLSGYSQKEFIGAHTRILKSGKQSKKFYKKLWDTIISGDTWMGEITNRKKNGKLFIEAARISPVFNEDGEVTHYLKVSNDITEEKKIKDELIRAKEKAEESDRLKTAFLANMSHEIRTPMNGILGFANLLLEPHLLDEKKEEYIRIINQSGERMLNTVSDIVKISKIEAGIVEIRKMLFNIDECIVEIVDFFQPQAQEKGLLLSYVEDIDNKDSTIYTDKGKFESIVTDLIKNAIKYTYTGEVTVNCLFKKTEIVVSVNDTGIGISPLRKDAIFNRFEQEDIEDTKVFEGSGLGLAIAKSYVEMIGGRIWVDSVERQGSKFYFTIPHLSPINKKAIKANTDNAIGETKSLKNITLLIVEDDEISAEFLETILDDVVRKVFRVNTGEKAVELCESNSDIDVILMDIKMSGIDGFEATRRIRKFNENVVIIAQTAYAFAGDRDKAISSGCNDYLSKPIKKDLLLEKLKVNLNKTNYFK